MQPELLSNYRIHGKIMHLLFERIKTKEDIESSIDSLISEGKLLTESKQELQSKIEKLLSSTPYDEWFSNKYKILNEVSILQKSGTSRPDRVLVGKNRVIIIDYKFGKLKSEKYHKQIRHYISLIKRMGYDNIEGYIWYINQDSTLEKFTTNN
jgi:ATP-dependent exoDNAse (exonuclease V) beta subunit